MTKEEIKILEEIDEKGDIQIEIYKRGNKWIGKKKMECAENLCERGWICPGGGIATSDFISQRFYKKFNEDYLRQISKIVNEYLVKQKIAREKALKGK
jgi:hypothetical protein